MHDNKLILYVLGTSQEVDNADLNGDGIINILDIVTLVNLILS